MVVTWVGHLTAGLFAIGFMMMALGLPLLFARRPPTGSCGRSGARGCICSAETRSTCGWTGNEGGSE